MSQLILASRSPQRRALLEQLGVQFSVQVAEVDELSAGPPHEVALENAFRKASAVAQSQAADGALVLGADTVVAVGSRIYGKPGTEAEARATLQALSARAHLVITGICLIGPEPDRAPRCRPRRPPGPTRQWRFVTKRPQTHTDPHRSHLRR